MPDNLKSLLLSQGTTREYKNREVIYSPGAPAPAGQVMVLLDGLLKIESVRDRKHVMVKEIVYPGRLFGEGLVFGAGTLDNELATSLSEATVVFHMPVDQYLSLARVHPSLMDVLLHAVGEKLSKKERRLAAFHFDDARKRLVAFIKELADHLGVRVGYETLVRHCFTQQDFANITGTSRQTVTCLLNEMKKANIIYFDRRRLLIRDMSRLWRFGFQ